MELSSCLPHWSAPLPLPKASPSLAACRRNRVPPLLGVSSGQLVPTSPPHTSSNPHLHLLPVLPLTVCLPLLVPPSRHRGEKEEGKLPNHRRVPLTSQLPLPRKAPSKRGQEQTHSLSGENKKQNLDQQTHLKHLLLLHNPQRHLLLNLYPLLLPRLTVALLRRFFIKFRSHRLPRLQRLLRLQAILINKYSLWAKL